MELHADISLRHAEHSDHHPHCDTTPTKIPNTNWLREYLTTNCMESGVSECPGWLKKINLQ
jgi:hypothetical protein